MQACGSLLSWLQKMKKNGLQEVIGQFSVMAALYSTCTLIVA